MGSKTHTEREREVKAKERKKRRRLSRLNSEKKAGELFGRSNKGACSRTYDNAPGQT